MVFAAAIYIIQPYKKPYHNIFDATLILTLAAIFSSHRTVAIAQLFSVDKNLLPSLILAFILSLLPIVYIWHWLHNMVVNHDETEALLSNLSVLATEKSCH